MTEQRSVAADAAAGSATGLEPQFAAAMAYLAGPLSGGIILMAERSNRFVRFHAWQAIFGLGGLALLSLVLLFLAFAGLFVSPTVFTTFSWLSAITALIWIAAWGTCLVTAFGGRVFKLPLVGDLSERRAVRGATRSS